MRELIKKLYQVSGNQSKRITNMFIFEVIKNIFEGMTLGAVLLFLLKITQNIFEKREILNEDIISVFAVAFMSVTGKIFFGYMADRNKFIASYTMGAENRLYIGDRLKRVNMGYFSNNRLGDIASGLTTVVGELETVGVYIIEMLFVGVIQTFIMAIFMIPFDFVTGVIIIAALIFGIIINNIFQTKADESTKKLLGLKINLNADMLEYVKGIGVIKSFGKGKEVLKNLEKSISENKKGFFDVEKAVAPVGILFLLTFKLAICLIIFASLTRYTQGEISAHKAIMLIVSSFIVFGGFEMTGSMQNIMGVAVQNLDALTKLRDIPTIEEGEKQTVDNCEIEMQDINFSYNDDTLFKNLSVVIPDGKTTAIVGPSGSGKTTLCNLMARFWDVNDGKILVGKTDVKDYSYDYLLSNFSFVFQDVYLFDDSIRNNIKFGNTDATDDEMIEVAKLARCHDFIMQLKDGYDTILQEGGSNLSGGERQRISIARAMLKPSKFVILDEATSSVDPENEEQLMTALKNLLKGKTAIIIAHKLDTIREADKIIVLDRGSVESIGTHDELMKISKVYKNFIIQRQDAIKWQLSN
ncbi:MAG: ABC transporter ATP-binding protein [Peptoanaerobacter stomatis]